MSLTPTQRADLERNLAHAVTGCSERGLYHGAKWAAELLNSLPEGEHSITDPPPAPDAHLERRELPRFLLAKALFDSREYDRAAAVFLPRPPPPPAPHPVPPTPPQPPLSALSKKAVFLALYAKYLAGEKRKDEESEMVLGPADGPLTPNKDLVMLSNTLEGLLTSYYAAGSNGDGWLEYLYGVFLAKGKNETQAKEWLIKSARLRPFHWGVWQELTALTANAEELQQSIAALPENVMTFIFHVFANQEQMRFNAHVHTALTQLLALFPQSPFLKSQRALLYYHSNDYEEAAAVFNDILRSNPFRLDSLDCYSNVLYVLGHRAKLSNIAQCAALIDKFRPETCCIIGNYYSIMSEHEKAVMYFRRALTLDRTFLSAWTLMGLEYIEMKNTHAALEAYRRAVDVNRRDYRAWYGMGQIYEILEMHAYGLYYYQRAAALRPFDPKMWMAVGASFARGGKLSNAIRAYKRALVAGSYQKKMGGSAAELRASGGALDPDTLYEVAKLYERVGDRREARAFMELVIAQEESHPTDNDATFGVGVTPNTSKARMWLAKFHYAAGDYNAANELATQLCQDGFDVEEAKALQRDIRARIEAM